MHIKRIISGLIPLPVLVFAIVEGGVWFVLLVAAAALLALWEYVRVVTPADASTGYRPIMLTVAIAAPVVVWSAHAGGAGLMMVAVGLSVVAVGASAVLFFPRFRTVFAAVPPGVFGLLYIPASLGFLVAIRAADNGVYWIFFIICMVFINDIGAFYCGTRFGKHKLWPAVSPGKTIEGSLGGLTACVLLGVIFRTVFLSHLPIGETLLFILCIGVAGPLGDLFESVLKRTQGVKDSGSIMPGHGGLLDRIDALLFAAPVAYVFRFYVFSA